MKIIDILNESEWATMQEANGSGYTYKDTDDGTYMTNTMGETLFIPNVSLQDQGFDQGSYDLPGIWQQNLEMADETGAHLIDAPVTETTSSGSIGTAMTGGKGPTVGTLFGGSYKPKTPFTAKKKAGKK